MSSVVSRGREKADLDVLEMTIALCNEWSVKRLQRQILYEAMRMRIERFH
jgi:hypothetical protein